jgi:hypothetical protein
MVPLQGLEFGRWWYSTFEVGRSRVTPGGGAGPCRGKSRPHQGKSRAAPGEEQGRTGGGAGSHWGSRAGLQAESHTGGAARVGEQRAAPVVLHWGRAGALSLDSCGEKKNKSFFTNRWCSSIM